MQSPQPITVPLHHNRIVVIDGDPAVRDSLATMLALEDHTVTTYATAAAFIRDLDDRPIDCLICEADLPDRTGLEVFLLLRQRHPETRFALLMSRKDPQLVARAQELGILDVFSKPLVHRSLLDFVTRSHVSAR
jgi:FixJ family two-component response regulator